MALEPVAVAVVVEAPVETDDVGTVTVVVDGARQTREKFPTPCGTVPLGQDAATMIRCRN